MSEETQALTPAEVRTVDFYGDQVIGAVVHIGGSSDIYVPVRPLCRYLGLDWSGQRQRIMRDDILADAVRFVVITPTNPQGGDPESLCLPLDLLPGFLFGVSSARIKPDLREKIARYRRECFRVLWEAFKPEILGAAELAPPSGPSGAAISSAQVAYETALAVANLARQQLDFEQRLDKSARWARGIEDRVSALEMQVGPQEHISDVQAGEVSLAVKTLAKALELQGTTNAYQLVWGELYRKFSVASYKNLPRQRYDEALTWLRKWFEEASSSGT